MRGYLHLKNRSFFNKVILIKNHMIPPKKHIVIIFISVIIFLGFVSYIIFFNESNQVLKEKDLDEYISTYLDTYSSIIEPPSNLTEDEMESFKFYKNYPYSAVGVISKSHGAAIQFVPKSREPYQLKVINENIEDILFPKIPVDAPDMWTIGLSFDGKAYVSNSTFVNMGIYVGKNGTLIFDGVSVIYDTPIFRKGNIELDGILINNGFNIIAKGSNVKKDWSKTKAEQEAKDAFFRELSFVIIEKSKLKGLGTLEITSQIENYREKEKKGIYENNLNEKINDREIIFDTADKYGIHYNSFEEILADAKYDSISARVMMFIEGVGILSTCISLLLIFIVIIIILKNKVKYNKQIYQSLIDEIKNIGIIDRIAKEIKKK